MSASAITFTLDLEDHRQDDAHPKRYPEMTRRVLDFLAEHAVRATVFVVGDLVRRDSALLLEIAEAGHELALHSYRHVALDRESPSEFARETRDSMHALEDLWGQPVRGFRAPVFSLTARTPWVPEMLRTLGFSYSSSVLPAVNPLYGFPGAPRSAFRWPCGLLEFPVPVAGFGPFQVPFLGGVYLRYLPPALITRWLDDLDRDVVPWIYLHPYDVDPDEPPGRMRDTAWWVSALLWFNRGQTLNRLARVLIQTQGGAAAPLAELSGAERFANVPTFRPIWRTHASDQRAA